MNAREKHYLIFAGLVLLFGLFIGSLFWFPDIMLEIITKGAVITLAVCVVFLLWILAANLAGNNWSRFT